MNAIDDSTWWRFPGGYVWLPSEAVIIPPSKKSLGESAEKDELVLSMGALGDLEEYRPPENLFLEFSNTAETPESIKVFADRFGLLGLAENDGAALVAFTPDKDKGKGKAPRQGTRIVGRGELLSAWRRHISEFRTVVFLWSAITSAVSGDQSLLDAHVFWPSRNAVYFDSHPHLPVPPGFAKLLGLNPGHGAGSRAGGLSEARRRTVQVIASTNESRERLALFRPYDCLAPARYYLQRLVNQGLEHKASPKLLWNVKRKRPDSLALYFVPENLLGNMWLQFAQAIDGSREFRQCAVCKTWILVDRSNEGSRSSRVTCSNACRMKRYEARKSEARQLHRNGVAIREIAKRLEADLSRVKRWVATP